LEVTMPRPRAYRRHQRQVKLARRYRILASVTSCSPADLSPKAMMWHLRCNCFDEPDANSLRRRRAEREWRSSLLDSS
jgi:hypothetical protein